MSVRANRHSTKAARFWALALSAAAALVLLCPAASWARSQHALKAAPTAVKAATPQAPKLAAAHPAAKGLNTGIEVHGHWVLEVKNPDGRIVRHVEFENSLTLIGIDVTTGFPTASGPITGPGVSLPGGAEYLNALVAGQAAPLAGNVEVALLGPGTTGFTTNGAPCVSLQQSFGACFILPPGNSCTVVPGVSCNLATGYAANLVSPGPIQFSGSVTATQNGSVDGVATFIANPCSNVTHCYLGSQYQQPIDIFTEVDDNTSKFPVVNVAPNQSLSVTVTISFQ